MDWIGLDISYEHQGWIGLDLEKMDSCPTSLDTTVVLFTSSRFYHDCHSLQCYIPIRRCSAIYK